MFLFLSHDPLGWSFMKMNYWCHTYSKMANIDLHWRKDIKGENWKISSIIPYKAFQGLDLMKSLSFDCLQIFSQEKQCYFIPLTGSRSFSFNSILLSCTGSRWFSKGIKNKKHCFQQKYIYQSLVSIKFTQALLKQGSYVFANSVSYIMVSEWILKILYLL